MFCVPYRCYNQIRFIRNGFIALTNNSRIKNSNKYYSDDKSCCKEVSQTAGKKVQDWPKPDSAKNPQPVNYDPYKIKVANVFVPPLPPSNAKEYFGEDGRGWYQDSQSHFSNMCTEMHDLFHKSLTVHPDHWKERLSKKLPRSEQENKIYINLGYHGKNKYKYAFHEPWKPLDRLSLLEEAEKEEFGISDKVVGVDK